MSLRDHLKARSAGSAALLLVAAVWGATTDARAELARPAVARHGRRVVIAVGFAVFSHFLLDLPMHPPDLALWPNSASHLGAGLWRISAWLVGVRACRHRGAVGLLLASVGS